MAKIGIPRAMGYYEFYPLWREFFQNLGHEVILSGESNSAMLKAGSYHCVDGACLPVKLFHGHVLDLKDQVDYLFIPRLTSWVKREYICPKFGGLPEMIRFSISDLPPLLSPELNHTRHKFALGRFFKEAGQALGHAPKASRKAYQEAQKAQREYKSACARGISPLEYLNQTAAPQAQGESGLKIALLGHAYNIYDPLLSMNVYNRLRQRGITVLTADEIGDRVTEGNCQGVSKPFFWTLAKRLYGSAVTLAQRGGVDGVVFLTPYGCGIDSMVAELSQRRLRRESQIPFMLVSVDEHSGEAGLETRLEAFTDMLERRKRHESSLSSSGACESAGPSLLQRSGRGDYSRPAHQ